MRVDEGSLDVATEPQPPIFQIRNVHAESEHVSEAAVIKARGGKESKAPQN